MYRPLGGVDKYVATGIGNFDRGHFTGRLSVDNLASSPWVFLPMPTELPFPSTDSIIYRKSDELQEDELPENDGPIRRLSNSGHDSTRVPCSYFYGVVHDEGILLGIFRFNQMWYEIKRATSLFRSEEISTHHGGFHSYIVPWNSRR